ncbi:MAG TPA: MASE4 domain-containing protein, partial [Roseateles sp.]|nr:MASE4 domain-containing protein [Roseateles sp.]
MLVCAAVFVALAPFATRKLAPVPAFIPIYESALVITDLITAVLLFGQYRILRLQALLVLGCGYLFTAIMASAHALTFPGLFSMTGLLGAGPQSTAWLYMLWHSGFPLFVLGYVLLMQAPAATARVPAFAWPAATLLLCAALILLATAGQTLLPAIMIGNAYSPAMRVTVGSVWMFSLLALLALWRRRPWTILDLWLMVVSVVWLFDIALSALLNAGRYDLGFYAGRIFGLLACSLVLMELLLENGVLYARLFQAYQADRLQSTALAAARDEAQAASAAKSMFLANMS